MDCQGLSLALGKAFEECVRHRFATPVTHPVLDRFSFSLVAAFGRCKFRLSLANVGSLL